MDGSTVDGGAWMSRQAATHHGAGCYVDSDYTGDTDTNANADAN